MTATYNCEDDLARDWQSPRNRSCCEAHAVVEPICNHDSYTDEQGLRGHETSAFGSFAKLRLIHGHRRGLDARSDASNEPRNHHMRNTIRSRLQHSTNL